MIYDALLLFGLLFAASVPLVGIDVETRERLAVETMIQTYLLLVWFAYFALSWRRGGRTLGMRAWKLRLADAEGRTPGWGPLIIRFLAALLSAAPFGAGYLWMLINARRETFHDRVSATYIYHET